MAEEVIPKKTGVERQAEILVEAWREQAKTVAYCSMRKKSWHLTSTTRS